ncbi:hypothetical protein GCK72_022888 [Caenorhabditis remanei]|uniref:MBD domain-containing protein n=1 Tax=Caenorhabditis remanei TaxID=31234 RepID=A0A6A5FV69_CAERE|nr:hypothetical protein GCK72_022888 [Caenorhabditis remanei]KAF1746433.1 hypothetical protein GCK72_022888 [Caenorhabditis remanei]
MGWRRQLCVRSTIVSEVKGNFSYFAQDGKKLSTYLKVVRILSPEDIADDVELMFANCRQVNTDHSDVGRA